MATQLQETESITESDLLQLLSPIVSVDTRNKYSETNPAVIEEKKMKILGIIQANYWPEITAAIAHLKSRRQKLKQMTDGIAFLAHICVKISPAAYDRLVELYLAEYDLRLLERNKNSNAEYEELIYT